MPKPASILVVDDSRDGREMLVEYLAFRGFQVSDATHGAAALELAERIRPDIILMDLSMPGMDGWEATRRLRATPTTKDTVIIAVSAHAFVDERQRAHEAGCDAFVTKPFDLAVLADAIARIASEGLGAADTTGVTLTAPQSATTKRVSAG
jgi:two-component system, cell cycle response regulator DivK